MVNGIPFIQIKRKGWKMHKWERVVSLHERPQISPFHLMQAYVATTKSHGKPGGVYCFPLFLHINPCPVTQLAQSQKESWNPMV